MIPYLMNPSKLARLSINKYKAPWYLDRDRGFSRFKNMHSLLFYISNRYVGRIANNQNSVSVFNMKNRASIDRKVNKMKSIASQVLIVSKKKLETLTIYLA